MLDMLQELGVDPQQWNGGAVPLEDRAVHTLSHVYRLVQPLQDGCQLVEGHFLMQEGEPERSLQAQTTSKSVPIRWKDICMCTCWWKGTNSETTTSTRTPAPECKRPHCLVCWANIYSQLLGALPCVLCAPSCSFS
jgi:hypothetical protein